MNKQQKHFGFNAALALAQVLHEQYAQQFSLANITADGSAFELDFSLDGQRVSQSDLAALETKTHALVDQNNTVTIAKWSDKVADNLKTNPYLADQSAAYCAVYQDICYPLPGTTESHTPEIGVIALTKISGAYWQGDENGPMLNRINGVSFATEKELTDYKTEQAEAEQRDHRRLGKEMDLFTFSKLVGPGLPLFTPNGAFIRKQLQQLTIELYSEAGYQEVHTPQLTKGKLFEVSGHLKKYRENLFSVKSNYSDDEYFLKPMNCPMHTQIYASRLRSYKDLPLRYADFANLYRDEKPGELSGLTRLRAFSQDDGHSFCTTKQVESEVSTLIKLVNRVLEIFELKPKIRLSLWDPNNKQAYLGTAEDWEQSQNQLRDVLEKAKIEHTVQEGEAAIYGPKIDFVAVDALGREWQISTIQLDFIMPKNFGLTYTDQKGKDQTPVMIHRALLGSPERFMALILEHFNGSLPTWLMPVQVDILPLSEEQEPTVEKLHQQLQEHGVRSRISSHQKNVGARIKEAEQEKVPYMLIVGKREAADKTVSVRAQGNVKNIVMPTEKFLTLIQQEITSRSAHRDLLKDQ